MAKKIMTLEEKLEEASVKEVPYDVPENWINVKLGAILKVSSGKGLTEKEVENYKVGNGDLVFIRVNGTKKNVGKAIQYFGNEICAYCDHLIRIDTDIFNKDYIKYLINSDKVRKQLNELIVSSAGQNTISQSSLNVIKVNLVEDLKNQKEIVSIINKLVDEEKNRKSYKIRRTNRIN